MSAPYFSLVLIYDINVQHTEEGFFSLELIDLTFTQEGNLITPKK